MSAHVAPTLFHLAFPVSDLDATRTFYVELLGCRLGREAPAWIDFDFFGHQITAHRVSADARTHATTAVDGDQVPVPHFGAILPWDEWHLLADRLRAHGVAFLIEPHVRFAGQPGEQMTMFLRDPSGNYLEFKAFHDRGKLFAS